MLSLSYGGFPLVLPTTEIVEAVAKLISTDVYPQPGGLNDAWRLHTTVGAESQKKSISSPTPPVWPEPPHLKLNQLYWPVTGASRFAYGYFLMTQFDYQSLNRNVPHNLSASFLNPVTPDEPEDPGVITPIDPSPNITDSINLRMFVLTPRVLIQLAGSADGLYVVPLVDERFFWQFQHIHFEDPDEIEDWKDWFDLVEPEVTKLRSLQIDSQAEPFFRQGLQPGPGGGSGKNFKPDPNTLIKPWSPLGLLVDAGIHTAGFRFVYAPNQTRISQPPESYSSFGGADVLLGGGTTDPLIPNKIILRSYLDCDSVIYEKNHPVGKAGFNATPPWIVGIDTTLRLGEDNDQYIDYYGDAITPRLFSWCKFQYDETYMGIHTNSLRFNTVNGTTDALLFSLGSLTDLQQSGHRLTTRVYSLPSWCLPRHLYVVPATEEKEHCCDGPLFNFKLKEDFDFGTALAEIFDIRQVPEDEAGLGEVYIRDTLGIFSELKKGHVGIAMRQCDEYHALQAPCPEDQSDESDVPYEPNPEEPVPEDPEEAKPI